jgi:hypothetical protein
VRRLWKAIFTGCGEPGRRAPGGAVNWPGSDRPSRNATPATQPWPLSTSRARRAAPSWGASGASGT